MVAAGARYVAARHEGGAATMADAYARMSGGVTALSLHQGCGLTNALTGITEAAKSRTPLVVVTAEATSPRSNFFVDQPALATAVGAVPVRVTGADDAVEQAAAAVATARDERRVVVLNLPLDVQGLEAPAGGPPTAGRPAGGAAPDAAGVRRLADALRSAPASGVRRRPRVPAARAAGRRSRSWPSAPAPCWRPRPSPRGCSRAARGTSTCPAGSPPRRPPS